MQYNADNTLHFEVISSTPSKLDVTEATVTVEGSSVVLAGLRPMPQGSVLMVR